MVCIMATPEHYGMYNGHPRALWYVQHRKCTYVCVSCVHVQCVDVHMLMHACVFVCACAFFCVCTMGFLCVSHCVTISHDFSAGCD